MTNRRAAYGVLGRTRIHAVDSPGDSGVMAYCGTYIQRPAHRQPWDPNDSLVCKRCLPIWRHFDSVYRELDAAQAAVEQQVNKPCGIASCEERATVRLVNNDGSTYMWVCKPDAELFRDIAGRITGRTANYQPLPVGIIK